MSLWGLFTFGLSSLVTCEAAWPELWDWKSSGLASLLTLILIAAQASLFTPHPEWAWHRGKSSGFGVRDSGGKPKSITDSVVKVFLSCLYTLYACVTGKFKKEIHFFFRVSPNGTSEIQQDWCKWKILYTPQCYTVIFCQDLHVFPCLPGSQLRPRVWGHQSWKSLWTTSSPSLPFTVGETEAQKD